MNQQLFSFPISISSQFTPRVFFWISYKPLLIFGYWLFIYLQSFEATEKKTQFWAKKILKFSILRICINFITVKNTEMIHHLDRQIFCRDSYAQKSSSVCKALRSVGGFYLHYAVCHMPRSSQNVSECRIAVEEMCYNTFYALVSNSIILDSLVLWNTAVSLPCNLKSTLLTFLW